MTFAPARRSLAAAAAIAVAALAAPASAQVTFILTPSGSIAPEALAGFTEAAAIWSAHLTSNATIRLNVGYSSLAAGVLASAGSTTTTVAYSSFRSSLDASKTSADDTVAMASLPVASSLSLYMNRTSSNPNGAGSATPWVDNNGSSNNANVGVNFSAARALGIVANSNTNADASITFSSNFTWDFNARDGVTGGQFDFVGIAVHEIGHALGFRSNVDALDGSPNNSENSFRPTALDLFRFSTDSTAAASRDFTADTREKYFSLNGGTTNIAPFSTGVSFGDGRQASHWKDSLGLGIMDPTSAAGELQTISENDLRALDVIGWTRQNTWGWGYADGGTFGTAINWKTRAVPAAAQDALFDLAATYTGNVVLVANTTIRDLIVRRDTLTLAPNNPARTLAARNLILGDNATAATASLTLTQGTLTLTGFARIGDSSAAAFTQAGGTVNADSILLANQPASTGAYTLAGGTLNAASITRGSGTASFTFNGGTLAATANTANLFANFAPNIAAGTAVINTNAFTVTIPSAITHNAALGATPDGGLTKLGTGTLILTGPLDYTGPTTLSAGTLRLAPGTNNNSVTLRALSLAANTTLDVRVNHVIVKDAALTVDTVRTQVATAYNAGLWNAPGITSSAALADGLALGFASNADLAYITFGGQPVTTNDLLIKYTWFGDADLNGQVDGDDYLLWLQTFNSTGPGINWAQGDFDYNNTINGDDYLLWLQNFGNGVGDPLAAVPEPGTLALTTLAAGALLTRRRRPVHSA